MEDDSGYSLDKADIDADILERDPLSSTTAEGQKSAASTMSKRDKAKAKRAVQYLSVSEAESESTDDEAHDEAAVLESKKQRSARRIEAVQVPPFVYPKSRYQDDELHSETSWECDVLKEALAYHKSHGSPETTYGDQSFISFDLYKFSMYRPGQTRLSQERGETEQRSASFELMGLHEKDARGLEHWFVDGYISFGTTRKYIQQMHCEYLSLGGYNDTDTHTIGSAFWIQTSISKTKKVWYYLREPAIEYQVYHEPFVWLADLSKHLVDYIDHHDSVSLVDFRHRFYAWICQVHGPDAAFQQWLQEYPDTDFCRLVAAHARFLYNEAALLGEKYAEQPLWTEIDPQYMHAVPKQTEEVKDDQGKRRTVVTPYVYECFQHLSLARLLDKQQPFALTQGNASTTTLREPVSDDTPSYSKTVNAKHRARQVTTIDEGDVVGVKSDSKSKWNPDDAVWYGYVQSTSEDSQGTRLHLLWLYRPSDTACQQMRYPFSRELFLSENCNCHDTPIYAEDVVSRPTVAFYGDGNVPNTDYFVRQKVNDDNAWTTVNQPDFKCNHNKLKPTIDYQVGDTWLMVNRSAWSDSSLQPVEILDDHIDGNDETKIKVRMLPFLRKDYGYKNADPNQLVYSSTIKVIQVKDLYRPCYVRCYTEEQKSNRQIPTPYDRKGTGDFYYVSHICHDGLTLQPFFEPCPTSLKLGFDPSSSPRPKLRGLSIFCGGGNFDRGLEEGGAVEIKWAVDYFGEAIHTYRANARDPDATKCFFGSVNEYLSQAMQGKRGTPSLIAQKGEVDFIVAGSPCQGFSLMNQKKGNDASLINISMVASVLAFVDFYRPKYALLENVPGMATCDKQGDNIYAQALCVIAGMGYQVETLRLDAWNYGAAQSRSRIFVSISAAGLSPLSRPPQSHAHPSGVGHRALGRTANGLPICPRHWDLTPFDYITIEEATNDLPLNQHGKLTYIAFPDHRLVRSLRAVDQGRIECIPKHPYGMSFMKTVRAKGDLMPKSLMESWNWTSNIRSRDASKAFQRVIPNALLPTVTTVCQPDDGLAGNVLHWEADRTLSIAEYRRAQGFPDPEVVLGSTNAQLKIIGNSVPRQLALSLGISLRKAWLANKEGPKLKLAEVSAEAAITEEESKDPQIEASNSNG